MYYHTLIIYGVCIVYMHVIALIFLCVAGGGGIGHLILLIKFL